MVVLNIVVRFEKVVCVVDERAGMAVDRVTVVFATID